MCQHYEHSAAESTIDLDSSHHMCRKLSENLLSPRCDHRECAPSPPPEAGSSRGDECDTIVTAPANRRPERSIVRGISTFSASTASAPGRTRTGNLRIRRPMLYPLSYGGVREAPHQPTPSTRRPTPDEGDVPRRSSAPEDDLEKITSPLRERIDLNERMVLRSRDVHASHR